MNKKKEGADLLGKGKAKISQPLKTPAKTGLRYKAKGAL